MPTVGVSVGMNIIIDRTHCAVGLKIEVVNEGTIRIDCSEIERNYNPTLRKFENQLRALENEAATKARKEFMEGLNQANQPPVSPDPQSRHVPLRDCP
jgi:hypothetical protein